MIYDGVNRFREGGQSIRRDGMILRSERRAVLRCTRPDSHYVVTPTGDDPRLLRWVMRVVWTVAIAAFVLAWVGGF